MTPNTANHHHGPETAARRTPISLGDRVRSLRLSPDMAAGGGGGGRAWLPWTLVALLAACTLYLGYGVSNLAPPEPAKSEAARPVVRAKAGAKGAPGSVVYEAKGYVIPVQQIQVSPKVGGMVEKLYVLEGRRVKAGEILCELEQVDYQADYDRAQATLKGAEHRLKETEDMWPLEVKQTKAELESAEAEHKQLDLDYKRNLNLRNNAAARDLEMAESAARSQERKVTRLRFAHDLIRETRKERIDALRADVKQAQADVVKAKWRLDNCIIRAPITGTILTKKTEQWNIVNPVAFNVSASICEMADLTQLEVDLTVQERDIGKIFIGQKCRIKPDAATDKTYPGEVSRRMPIADRSKGTISVRVRVTVPREEEGLYLRPEGAALVSFLRGENDPSPAAKKRGRP